MASPGVGFLINIFNFVLYLQGRLVINAYCDLASINEICFFSNYSVGEQVQD